jgi:hypothetical protein
VVLGMTDTQPCYVGDEISWARSYHMCHVSVCSRKEKLS